MATHNVPAFGPGSASDGSPAPSPSPANAPSAPAPSSSAAAPSPATAHSPATAPGPRHATSSRLGFINGRVAAWAAWDTGSSSFNAVVTTFVFSVYLTTSSIFGPSANSNLGWTMAVAGVFVALIAPVLGQWTDRTGKTRTVLAASTFGVIVIMAALFFVEPDESFLWLGLILLALGNVIFETGSVIYNSMVADVATPRTVGRVSGFGWGMGYIGSIVLLVFLLFAFIQPDPGLFGVTHENSMHIRVSMVVCAVWMLVFTLPFLLIARNHPPASETPVSLLGSYRALARSVARLWKEDRSIVWFLLSSAIYRDGLAGVFAFGGILAGAAFGFSESGVVMFAVGANLVAGVATVAFGQLDDRLGARKVIIGSLVSMCILGLLVFFGEPAGPIVFWVFGLALCIFVGPAQAASRSYLARIAPRGSQGEIFGLYATTGRAVSFLAPFMYASAITLAHRISGQPRDDVAIYGVLGIVLVLFAGLLAFLPVKAQAKADDGRDVAALLQ
ncbi:MAG: MFS transporter [Actinomycetaceae bacterium]|nr:MFS transporter [Actinomycetaceae bacterium]